MAHLCRRFRFQLFRRREVNLLLLFNLLITIVFQAVVIPPPDTPPLFSNIAWGIGVVVFPIAGFLADIWYSRYRLVKISMWLVWVCVTIQSAVEIVFYSKGVCESSGYLCKGMRIAVQILIALGAAGFLSNIIQLSMDQLQDAPTNEVTSFIVWYIWTFNFGGLLGVIFRSCIIGIDNLQLVTTLFIPACISLALCLDSLFSHWLVKEPVSRNPFRLFFGVLGYAIKNKYPRQRSAFTYWEDKPYSRIDLAKDKYGGPFTTEQVEDVKIVLRVLAILSFGCVGAGLSMILVVDYDVQVLYHLSGGYDISLNQYCSGLGDLEIFVIKYFYLFVIFFFIPVHEMAIYPVFKKHIQEMNSVTKYICGLFFLVLKNNVLMMIEAIGYYYTDAPVICFMLQEKQFFSLSFKWYCFSGFFVGLGVFYISSAAIEFICSQAPYSMKGLIFGSAYLFLGLSLFFIILLLLPVSLTVENWHPVPYGCGVWFYLCATVFFLLFTLLCIIVFKKVYRMRRRDEDLHNRHIFAINYYSHYVQQNGQKHGN